MLFGPENRFRYAVNPLVEVICQLRFPAILTIGAREPVDFQDAVRADFPRYSMRDDHPAPKLTGVGTPSVSAQAQPPVRNYSFLSEDGGWKLNLTPNFIALSTARYTTWEDFAARLDRPLATFIEIYRPSFFERVGLRYVNAIARSAAGLGDTPWRELIEAPFLGLLASGDADEGVFSRATTDSELGISDGIKLKLHTGPGHLQRPGSKEQEREPRFILDADFSASGNIPLPDAAARLEQMHSYSTRLIRAAFTETLHEALGPEPL